MAQADHNVQQQPVNPAADNTAAGTATVTPDGVTVPVDMPDVGELATADTSDAHAAIVAPTAQSARISSSASDTRTEVPETPRQKSGSHTHQFIGFAGLGLAIVAIYLVTKLQKECQEALGHTKKLGDELRQRDSQIADMQNELASVKTQLSSATDKLNTLSTAVAGLNRKQTQESRQQRTTDSALHPGAKTATTEQQHTAPAPVPVKKGDVYYATPQLENDVARFWTRTMRSEASPEKMFCLEVLDNTGTYTVNPAATDMIQNDLEMFSTFVKPFTAPSGSNSRTISVIKPGKVTLQGQYWVITDKLEVTIQ